MTDLESRGDSLEELRRFMLTRADTDTLTISFGEIRGYMEEERRKLSVLHAAQESILMQEITSLKAQLKNGTSKNDVQAAEALGQSNNPTNDERFNP